MKDILRGQVEVASDAWTCWMGSEKVAIRDLDEPVADRAKLSFELFYPFDRAARYEVIAAGERVTLREVVAAIRAGYRDMWTSAGHRGFTLEQLRIAWVLLYEESGRLRVAADVAEIPTLPGLANPFLDDALRALREPPNGGAGAR